MNFKSHWPEAGKYIIMLTLGWCSFSILFGLHQAFDVMESSQENIASKAILDALKTAGMLVVGGSFIFIVPWIALILKDPKETRNT